jgi:hypothetical protein
VSRLSTKYGRLDASKPYGLPWPVIGIVLPTFLFHLLSWLSRYSSALLTGRIWVMFAFLTRWYSCVAHPAASPMSPCLGVERLGLQDQEFAEFYRHSPMCDHGLFLKSLNKIKTNRCNRPWRPVGLWDVEDPTMSTQSAHRGRRGCQPYAPAALYSPE